MRIAVAYNAPTQGAGPAETDVLQQVAAVESALARLGHEAVQMPCTLNLEALVAALDRERPALVFNLVEALAGTDRLAPLVPCLLDARGIPYTGTGSNALAATIDKVSVKSCLRAAGLPTPDWFVAPLPASADCSGRFIVKARSEHASIGLGDDAVVDVAGPAQLACHIARKADAFGIAFFAERFIEGREFNIALLADDASEVRVLPPAEIDFSAFAADKPRIVGHDAKWEPASFEYNATPRCFEFEASDAALLRELRELSRRVWALLGLRGYARVDLRVDDLGKPWILEVNPNPCIAPDAGFAAALEAAGLSFEEAVARMLQAAASD